MSDQYLFTPDQLEDLAIDTIGRPGDPFAGILYSLGKLERLHGLRARTIEPPKTVSHMSSPDASAAAAGDRMPAISFQCSGLRAGAERSEDDTLHLPAQLAMRVSVMGSRRRETLRRRDWLTMAAVETLMQRMPRHALVAQLDLLDCEPIEHADDKRIHGEYSIAFNVWIPDAITLRPQFPRDGISGPAGPYDPPDEPPVVEEIEPGIVKVPLTEDV